LLASRNQLAINIVFNLCAHTLFQRSISQSFVLGNPLNCIYSQFSRIVDYVLLHFVVLSKVADVVGRLLMHQNKDEENGFGRNTMHNGIERRRFP
jgi:hypothetical protein